MSTHWVMRSYWSILADTLAELEAVTLGDTQRDAHALVDTLADTQAEVGAQTLGDTARCTRTGRHSG